MNDAELLRAWLLLILGTAGASIFAGSEMGAYAINRVRLSLRASLSRGKGTPRMLSSARTLKDELDNPTRLLAALLLGYNITSYLAAEGLTMLLEHWGFGSFGILVFTVFIATPLLFVVNDAAPKELFRLQSDRLMYAVAPLLRLVRCFFLYTGVLPVIGWLTKRLAALVPGGISETTTPRQNMAELLKEGARHGVISESQASLLDRAMSLRDTSVGDEMIPWLRCHTLSETWSRSRVLDFISAYPQSRFPLVNTKGQLLGLVDAIDVLTNPDASLTSLARPAMELDPVLSVRDALARLNAAGQRLAVVKLRGKPVGIVTAKDLVEPLTGELEAW